MTTSAITVAQLTPGPSVPGVIAAARPIEAERPLPALAVAAAPPAPSTFSVDGRLRLDGRLGHGVLPGGSASETYVLVEVGAGEATSGDARVPANLSIVIDRSGSMKGKRLANALAAARGMLSRLRPDDTLSLVAYADSAEVLIPPTTVDRIDRRAFERALAGIRGRGHTCMSCGVELAQAQVRQRSGAVNRILLLSDGVANRGLTTPQEFRALGDAARLEQTAVASIGVDLDYDERTLFAVSQASNGHHYFVEAPTGLAAVFEREAASLVGSVADRVDVDVVLAEGVELLEVVARGHRREGNHVTVAFGSMNAGETKSALLRVAVAAGAGDRDVAEIALGYRDLAIDRDAQARGSLGLTLDPVADRVGVLDPRVEARLGRRDTQDALISANGAFTRGDVRAAQRELDQARQQVRERLTRSEAAPNSALEANFNEQLGALERAKRNFEVATVVAEPTVSPGSAAPSVMPAAVPKRPAGKKAIRDNIATADPFG